MREKIRVVCATRVSPGDFMTQTALGRSLALNQSCLPTIEMFVDYGNSHGLPDFYNAAIEAARYDPAILVFVHDDVHLCDYYWSLRLMEAVAHFDLVGLIGNRRRAPRQPSWAYPEQLFVRDSDENLIGLVGLGKGYPCEMVLGGFNLPGQECKLLDGLMLAVRSPLLIERNLRFDPRFPFHFYDMDFCRQAELTGLRMGTWPLSAVHESPGSVGTPTWQAAYQLYLQKYGE